MARQAAALALALTLALALAWAVACGGSSEGGGLSLEADDFYFKPKEIRAQAGQPPTLRIENEGRVPHTFTIASLGVDVELGPGEERVVTLTPTGEAEFVCRFHQAQGMRGRIVAAQGATSY